MSLIKLMIADDQALIREGLATLLSHQTDIEVIGKAENGAVLLQLIQSERPDIVLLDIHMPVMDGLQALKKIKHDYPDTQVIMLTTFADHEYILQTLKNGAIGFVLKDTEIDQLYTTIRQCVNGQMVFPASIQSLFFRKVKEQEQDVTILMNEMTKRGWGFNERELVLLQLLFNGLTNKQIADELFLSVGTVKNYISQLYRKMNITSRSDLMVILHEIYQDNELITLNLMK